MAKRLVEMNARKREERLIEDKQQLEKLINIKKCYDRGEMKDYQKQMRQNLISNREELEVWRNFPNAFEYLWKFFDYNHSISP